MTPLIDVCIATYKRPESLERLLRSLVTQETAGRFRFALRIADNDAAASAGPVVRRLQQDGIEISYAVEPRQSVSHARNRSFSLAAGDLIATIDDDLYAGPGWLLAAFDALERYDADVVHGPVLPEFPPDTAEYLKETFFKPSPATGSTSAYPYSTANSLFRRTLTAGNPEPFDPACGRTGGEDTKFFNALRDAGRRMVFCREAVVFSPLSPERATLRSVLRRKLQFGNNAARFGYDEKGVLHLFGLIGWIAVTTGVGLVYLTGGLFVPRLRVKALSRFVMALELWASLFGRLAHYAGLHFEQYVER